MEDKRDYYEVLGVDKNADEKTIKKAYRELAMKYHPDVSEEESAADKFKEISEAYAVLSDDEKRQRYDQFGHAGMDGCGVLPGRISQFASQRKKAPGCIQSAASKVIAKPERFQSGRNYPDDCHKSTCQLESRRRDTKEATSKAD